MFPPLLADVHEVSNQQYRYCVHASRCPPPDEPANDAGPGPVGVVATCQPRLESLFRSRACPRSRVEPGRRDWTQNTSPGTWPMTRICGPGTRGRATGPARHPARAGSRRFRRRIRHDLEHAYRSLRSVTQNALRDSPVLAALSATTSRPACSRRTRRSAPAGQPLLPPITFPVCHCGQRYFSRGPLKVLSTSRFMSSPPLASLWRLHIPLKLDSSL